MPYFCNAKRGIVNIYDVAHIIDIWGFVLRFYLFLCFFVRVLSENAEIPVLLQVIDSRAIVNKTVRFHRAVHIALRHTIRFFKRRILQFFIKTVFEVMIDYHLILGSAFFTFPGSFAAFHDQMVVLWILPQTTLEQISWHILRQQGVFRVG